MLFEFAEKFITGVTLSILLVAIVNFFGVPHYFDPVILVSFFAIALMFRRNRDLVAVCIIFLLERLFEELGYQTITNIQYDFWVKIPIYLVLTTSLIYCTRGKMRLFSIAFMLLAITVEVYWLAIEYKPRLILWTCFLFTLSLWVRWSLRRRVFWMINLTQKHGQPLDLDLKLINATLIYVCLHVLTVSEFYLRHVFGYKDITYVYYAYPYVSQVLNCFILYNILIESLKYLRTIELRA